MGLSLGWSSILAGVAVAGLALQAPHGAAAESGRAHCDHHTPLRQAFFGDLHIHTVYSLDTATSGTPRDAYAFARGEAAAGEPAPERPLDFAAVTDHAEWLGEMRICADPEHPGHGSDICWGYRQARDAGLALLSAKARAHERYGFCGKAGQLCAEASRQVWRDTVAAAEAAYDRCSFTSFSAWEWTGTADGGRNLHRNVILAGDRVPQEVTSYVEAPSARALWRAVRSRCDEASGCDAIIIPHNSNLSGGLMFEGEQGGDLGGALSEAEARERAELEPLIEIMQHKGDSECLLGQDTRDEACAFEKLPYDRFEGATLGPRSWDRLAPTRSVTVREALKRGLTEEARLGVNPFAYGLLASTDTHTGRPGSVSERGYEGHTSTNKGAMKGSLPDVLQYNPGGLAGVFAEENTRESLFAALERKEVFGTSGPRISVRFFGGTDFSEDLCAHDNFVEAGYAGGVPMGGRLPSTRAGTPPTFAVFATQDAGTQKEPGQGLERIQIVKGWLAGDGLHERVIDVSNVDVNAELDLATCTSSEAGAESLCAVWRDPDFDPTESAFYYARVLETPSCRWSQLACNERGVNCDLAQSVPPDLAPCCHPIHRRAIQERAWSSPIWYRQDDPPAMTTP